MTLTYFTFKSDEKAGAGGPNIVGVENPTGGLQDDLVALVNGDLMSTSVKVADVGGDYSYPYPAGSRFFEAFELESDTASDHLVMPNFKSDTAGDAWLQSCIDAGMLIWSDGSTITRFLRARSTQAGR